MSCGVIAAKQGDVSAQQAGSLADAGESEALFAGTLRVETGSPVLDADPHRLVMVRPSSAMCSLTTPPQAM